MIIFQLKLPMILDLIQVEVHTLLMSKIAQLDWKLNPKVKLSMGLIGNKQFNDQESLWGYTICTKRLSK